MRRLLLTGSFCLEKENITFVMLQTTFLYILWLDSVLALNFNFGFFGVW